MNFLKKLYAFSTTWTGTIIIVLFLIFFVAQAFIIPSRSMVNTLYEGDLLFVKKFSYGIPIPRIPWIEVPVLPDFRDNGHIIEGKRPTRGEIVIFIPPHLEKTYFVKRTFATGGDEVVMAKDGLYLRPAEGDSYIAQKFADFEKREFMGKIFVKNPLMREFKGIHYNEIETISYNMLLIRANTLSKSPMKPFEARNGEIYFYHKVEEDHFFMVGDNRDGSEDSRFWGSVPYRDIIGTPWFIYFSLNLANSDESKIDSKNTYKIRWERMFKGVEGLEKLAKKKADSAIQAKNAESDKIKSVRSTQNSPASWCKKSDSKGAVVPPADFLLEAEKRGTLPKSEKAELFGAQGERGGGCSPFCEKELRESEIQNNATIADFVNQIKNAESTNALPLNFVDCHELLRNSRNDGIKSANLAMIKFSAPDSAILR